MADACYVTTIEKYLASTCDLGHGHIREVNVFQAPKWSGNCINIELVVVQYILTNKRKPRNCGRQKKTHRQVSNAASFDIHANISLSFCFVFVSCSLGVFFCLICVTSYLPYFPSRRWTVQWTSCSVL